MTEVSEEPATLSRPLRAGRVMRFYVPLLLLSLLWLPSVRAEMKVSPEATATVMKQAPVVAKKQKKSPQTKIREALNAKRFDVIPPAPAKLTLPIVPQGSTADRSADNASPTRRQYIEVSGLGLLIGDYQLQPRLALGTDNRLDDVNTRERVLRDEMDARESARRGEVHEDAISAWLRTRGQPGLPGVDPGLQVATAIQRVLRGNIRIPNFLDYGPAPRPVHTDDKR